MYVVVDRWNRTIFITETLMEAQKYQALKLSELAADDPTVDRRVFDSHVKVQVLPLNCEFLMDRFLQK